MLTYHRFIVSSLHRLIASSSHHHILPKTNDTRPKKYLVFYMGGYRFFLYLCRAKNMDSFYRK